MYKLDQKFGFAVGESAINSIQTMIQNTVFIPQSDLQDFMLKLGELFSQLEALTGQDQTSAHKSALLQKIGVSGDVRFVSIVPQLKHYLGGSVSLTQVINKLTEVDSEVKITDHSK